MEVRASTRRMIVALATSCLLLLQTLGTSLAMGSMANGPMLDSFGNVLCLSASTQQQNAHSGSAVPACCALGCQLANILLGAPPEHLSLVAQIRSGALIKSSHGNQIILVRPDHDPSQPRAPPFLLV